MLFNWYKIADRLIQLDQIMKYLNFDITINDQKSQKPTEILVKFNFIHLMNKGREKQ